ncbi:MAG: C4-type zinc ribbon domain-containing protein [candidate division WOR-3 bacterium]
MREVLRLLTSLQQTDTDLKILANRLAAGPQRVAELRRTAEELKLNLQAARNAITEHHKQYKLAEVELRGTEEKINSYTAQMYSAKTNEQYKAFLKEIEAQRRLAAAIEDRMITLMEELEILEAKAAAAEKQTAEVNADVTRKLELLETEQRELQERISSQQARRAEIVAALPPEILRRYERIKASKSGVAVASTGGGRCSGCLSPIPPQRLLEIESAERLFVCEACGRILVPPDEFSTDSK